LNVSNEPPDIERGPVVIVQTVAPLLSGLAPLRRYIGGRSAVCGK